MTWNAPGKTEEPIFKVPERAVAVGGPKDGETIELMNGSLRVAIVSRPTARFREYYIKEPVRPDILDFVEYVREQIVVPAFGFVEEDNRLRPKYTWIFATPSFGRLAAMQRLDVVVGVFMIMAQYGGWTPAGAEEPVTVFERPIGMRGFHATS